MPDFSDVRIRTSVDPAKGVAKGIASRHPVALKAAGVLVLVLMAATVWAIVEVFSGLPTKDELRTLGDLTQSTTIYDVNDQKIFTIPTEYRIEIPLARVSKNLSNAVVAVEDARFFEHGGVDGIRIVGAIIEDLRERRKAEGASTITQQLARSGFLSRDKTLRRKVREAILATRLERLYTKDEILEMYLNKVYFGDGLYGAEAAAQGYFGKPASDLDLAEGALIAGLVQAPSGFNPTVHPEKAVERRNLVLKLMLENKLIDRPSFDQASAEPLALRDTLRRDDPVGAHFKEQVRRELVERFGKRRVYEDHLKVYSTIDPKMQRAAEEAVVGTLRELDAKVSRAGKDPLEAALVVLDTATGEVRALVGGRETTGIGLNRAWQSKRQPGSAFKPFVYAAAIESGYSPSSVLTQLDKPVETYKGMWLPEDEHSSAAEMTIRTALRTSSNRAAVQMLEDLGLDRVVHEAERFGVGAVPNVPSLALGAGEVTLASMTAAYGAFARGGVVRSPMFIRRIEDQDGAALFVAEHKETRAVSETTAFLMASMLADVIDAGTANKARAMGFTLPAAGKTGTTNDFVDAWFIGFTPKLVAGVWMGFDQPRTIMKNGFAGQLAVPLWTRFMKVATEGDPPTKFEPPAGVVAVQVCRISGMLPVPGCKNAGTMNMRGEVSYKNMVYTDYFLRGSEPIATCPVHVVPTLPYPEPYFNISDVDSLRNVLSVTTAVTPTAAPPAPPAPAVAPVPTAAPAPPSPIVPPNPIESNLPPAEPVEPPPAPPTQ